MCGGVWQASGLRFQALAAADDAGGSMLVGTLSPLGVDTARRIARGHGIAPSSVLDDCCCRRAAADSRASGPRGIASHDDGRMLRIRAS